MVKGNISCFISTPLTWPMMSYFLLYSFSIPWVGILLCITHIGGGTTCDYLCITNLWFSWVVGLQDRFGKYICFYYPFPAEFLGVCANMDASVIYNNFRLCRYNFIVFSSNRTRILRSVISRLCTLVERSFLCSNLYLWSHISNTTKNVITRGVVHCLGLYFWVKKVKVCAFHFVDR